MKFFFVLLAMSFLIANASYQPLTIKPQAVQKPAFKLEVQDQAQTFTPSNVGIIGIKYLHSPGSMSTVISVYPQTPAQRAGILVGDRLLEVDGVSVVPFTSNQLFAAIAGRPGQPIHLKLMRCGQPNISQNCYTYSVDLQRMDMNEIPSNDIFNIYKYGG